MYVGLFLYFWGLGEEKIEYEYALWNSTLEASKRDFPAALTNMFNLTAIAARFSKIPSHPSVEKLHHHAKQRTA